MPKNPKIVFDIEPQLAKIDNDIKKYEKLFKEVQKQGSQIGIGEDLKADIQSTISELQTLKKELEDTFQKFSQNKLDTSQFDKFTKEVSERFTEINKRLASVESTVSKLSKQFGNQIGIDKLTQKIGNLQKQFTIFKTDVKESIDALKEFGALINSSGNQGNVREQIKYYEKLANVLEGIDFGSKKTSLRQTDVGKLEKQLSDLYNKYSDLDNALQNSNDPVFIEKTQKEIGELLPKLANVYNAIIKIKDIDIDFGGDEIVKGIGLSFKDIALELNNASSEIQTIFSGIASKLKSSFKEVKEEVGNSTSEMFQFKDGKIQIPVILDKGSITTLQSSYKEIIETLQKYATNNPVDVVMRLFPLNTTKAGQTEVKKAVKDVQAQIANLPEGELKTSMTSLYNNLEQQYQKALRLKISVELSSDATAVKNDIKAIQDAINDEPLTLYPKFVIEDKVAEDLAKKLKSIQENFTFNITEKITSMSTALKELLNSGSSKEWVEGFLFGLNEIENKLQSVKTAVQPINDLMGIKGKGSKDKVVNQNDVDIITAFTDAMNSLRDTLNKQQDITIDIDIEPLIEKLDVIKATVGVVISELGNLQATLNNIKSNQSITVDENLIKQLQETVSKSEPIKIPITPDLSMINSFVSKIEEAVSNVGIKLNVNGLGLSKENTNSLKTILQHSNAANELYHQIYYGLDETAQNIGDSIKRTIALSLVSGLREGLSSTTDMLRIGFKGTPHESILEQIIGDEESLNNIKQVANEVTQSFLSSFNKDNFSVEKFIDDIESQIINSGKTVHIPIGVLASSVDSFIKEAQSIIDSKDNISSDDKSNGDQITSLNSRIGNLQKKIDSVWDNWVKFGEGATQGSNTAIESINKVIAKLGDLAVKLNEISEKFKGVNFGDKIGEVSNLIFNNGRSDFDIGEIISQMMEADKILKESGREIRERAFYYNSKNGRHSNTYTYDQPTSYGIRTKLLKNNNDDNEYDTFIHTHPEKHATMSLSQIDKKTRQISGDILAFYYDYLHNIGTQIIAAQDDVEIFDAKKFYDKYKNIFEDKNIGKKIDEATKEVFGVITQEIDNYINAFKKSSLSYKDLVKDKTGNIFDTGVPNRFTSDPHGANIAHRALMWGRDNDLKTEEEYIKQYFEEYEKNPDKKSFTKFLANEIKSRLSDTDKARIKDDENLKSQLKDYVENISKRFFNNIYSKAFQQLYDIATPDILKKVGIDDFDNYIERMPIEEFREKYSGIVKASEENNIKKSTEDSSKNIDKESQAMAELYDKAIAAAEAKEKFVNANKEVFESITTSLSALNAEGNGFANLNKIINNLANNKNDRITDMIANLELLRDALTKPIDSDAFINVIKDIASQGESLKDLAKVLRASKKQIERAKNVVDSSPNVLDNTKKDVISTQHSVRIGADGKPIDISRSFKATEETGRTVEYTKRGTEILIKTTTDYQKAIKQTSDAIVEQAKAQHELDIEQSKTTPNAEKVQALNDQIADCTRRIQEATNAASQFDNEMRTFYNDPNTGSKFNQYTDFATRVQQTSASRLAQEEKRYAEYIANRNRQFTQEVQNDLSTVNIEIDNGNHTDDFNQRLIDIRDNLQIISQIPIDSITEADVERAKEYNNELKRLAKEGKLSGNKLANENSIAKGLSQINNILSGNTKSSFKKSSVYQEFKLLQSEFKNFDTSRPQSELQALTTRLLKAKADFEELSDVVKGKNFFETFVERLRGANAQLIAQYLSFQDIIRYSRTLITTLVDLDTQLVDLRKTTTMNNNELNEFYRSSADVAKQLGVTTSEIISQASAWSRLGYSSNESATAMAKLSSQFASISPGMSTDEAQTGLVSIMKAWKVDVADVSRDIMDNINTLGNKFAETNLDIVEGMERAGATLSAIGTSVQDSFALFTGAQEVIQNAETVGTALKTLSLRIRGYDEETEELSDDVIEAMGKVANLTKVASNNYAGVSLWADAEQTKYRSLKDYLSDIAKIWDEISEGNRTDLLEKLFGKRGASVGSAILGNFEQVENAIEEMQNAAGSSDREMSIIRDSLEFKLNAIKQEWIETLTTITDRKDFGNILDGILSISEGLGWLISKLGLLQSAIVSVSTVIGSQKLG